jgi:hypothetical protein
MHPTSPIAGKGEEAASTERGLGGVDHSGDVHFNGIHARKTRPALGGWPSLMDSRLVTWLSVKSAQQ